MQVTLTDEQVLELGALVAASLGEMSHEIAATDNSRYREGLVARRRLLEEAAEALRRQASGSQEEHRRPPVQRPSQMVWTAEITFTEDEDRTRADAHMRAAEREWHGWGRSRRNPTDPDVPIVGEELAAGRALESLADQLVEAAAFGVAMYEGHPVRLHV